ncbi:unnamed protein product [Nezara viridula]|uniref:Uncharacterized protein n=1 Tax=Nezara viridula TaxID=85310 RepID=A0A9P0MW59_NEZVI|nr:unnamed protein product [Nezara viridula]
MGNCLDITTGISQALFGRSLRTRLDLLKPPATKIKVKQQQEKQIKTYGGRLAPKEGSSFSDEEPPGNVAEPLKNKSDSDPQISTDLPMLLEKCPITTAAPCEETEMGLRRTIKPVKKTYRRNLSLLFT